MPTFAISLIVQAALSCTYTILPAMRQGLVSALLLLLLLLQSLSATAP
jgi:hypothetical protein